MIEVIKKSSRLNLQLDGGMKGDKQVRKSKTFSNVRPEVDSLDLYQVGRELASLQKLGLLEIRRLDESLLLEQ